MVNFIPVDLQYKWQITNSIILISVCLLKLPEPM